MYGNECYSDVPYSTLPEDQEQFSADTSEIILSPGVTHRFLLEAKAYDPSTSSETTFHASTHSFTRSSDDQFYEPVLDNPYSFNASLFGDGGINSGAAPSFGAITMLNGDGSIDHLTDLFWGGRDVVVKIGLEGFVYSQYRTVFKGVANDLEWDEDKLTISLRDPREKLQTEVQQNKYTGQGLIGGEYTGDNNIAGTLKPLVYGEVFNMTPVLVDANNLVYQVHDGEIFDFGITFVRDNGINLENEGNSVNLSLESPSAGAFVMDDSRGLFKLGSTPAGSITVDMIGHKDAISSTSTGLIVNRIVRRHFGFTDDDINQTKINEVHQKEPGAIGIVLNGSESGVDILDRIMTGIGGWWTFNRLGELEIGLLEAPTGSSFTIDDDDLTQQSVRRSNPGDIVWRQRIGYQKRWTVQSPDGLATSISAEGKSLYSREYDYIDVSDESVKDEHITARQSTINTLFRFAFFPEPTIITRYIELFKVQRHLYRLPLTWHMFRFNLGDVITLQVDRFGLTNGKQFRIVGINEDAKNDRVTIDVWG